MEIAVKWNGHVAASRVVRQRRPHVSRRQFPFVTAVGSHAMDIFCLNEIIFTALPIHMVWRVVCPSVRRTLVIIILMRL